MSAPLSIIIPALRPTAELGQSVAALFEGLECGLIKELIISVGQDRAEFEALAGDLGATLITGPASRGGQLRRGAQKARGQWMLFLHSDTILENGWSTSVQNHIAGHADHAGFFQLAFKDKGIRPRLLAFWANLRCRLFGLPYGDQGLLVSRALYKQIGGFQDIPLMEDVAMARALKGRLKALGTTATTSANRYQRVGYLRQSVINFSILMRYFWGVSPETLAKAYQRKR